MSPITRTESVGSLIAALQKLDPETKIENITLNLATKLKPPAPDRISKVTKYADVGLTKAEALCGLPVGTYQRYVEGFEFPEDPDYLTKGDEFIVRSTRNPNLMFLGTADIDGFKHPDREHSNLDGYINVRLAAFDYSSYANSTIYYRRDGWEFFVSKETKKRVADNRARAKVSDAMQAAEAELRIAQKEHDVLEEELKKAATRVDQAKKKLLQLTPWS